RCAGPAASATAEGWTPATPGTVTPTARRPESERARGLPTRPRPPRRRLRSERFDAWLIVPGSGPRLAAVSSTAMLGWGPGEIPLLIVMPALLLVSAFCSGSETALFGMRGHERAALRSRDDAAARAARTLLANPRLL